MRFPGKRKTKHYFPVTEHTRVPLDLDLTNNESVYVVGIDQVIVDVEAEVSEKFLERFSLKKGESFVIEENTIELMYKELKDNDAILGEYAGGAVGNTLHNYSVLADDRSVAFGSMSENIKVGDYAYKYICTTNSHVDLSYLKPCNGNLARAMCLITPDSERTFAIGKGIMNDLTADYINEDIIKGASALLVSGYLLRDEKSTMFEATLKAVKLAKNHNIPVVMALGTASLVEEKKDYFLNFIKEYVSVLALNESEMKELVGEKDHLLSLEKSLEYCDFILLTVGSSGLYIASYCDEEALRKTKDKLHSKSISEYNQFEYSRAMARSGCNKPKNIYTHINPFLGGPGRIKNTNGAGDAALSAVLHDISANAHHKKVVPNSSKHKLEFLTYSSIHQVAKYANRASFEVLNQNSPRLAKGLPQQEDSLEQDYWDL